MKSYRKLCLAMVWNPIVFLRSWVKAQGHRGLNIADFGPISSFLDDNSTTVQYISVKLYRKLCLAMV